MDPTALLIAVSVLCAFAGFGVALLWSRSRPSHDETEIDRLRAALMEAARRGAAFEERAKQIEPLQETVRQREQAIAQLQREAGELRTRGAELATRLEEEREQGAEKLRLMTEATAAFENKFKALSADALQHNNQSFLDLAKATLAEFQQGAKGDLEKRQMAIDALVGPVKASLDKVDEKIQALEKSREQAYGEIRQQFTQMAETQNLLRQETTNLVKALRQPHVRGRWGEVQLRRVVEMAGMLAHCDFVEQESGEGEDGKLLRPDVIVRLPGNRQIIVDSKAPVSAYLDAHEATTDEVRKAKIREHAQLVRGHLQALSQKRYWEQFQPTPEVVVMFIPGEAFCSAALESDPELLDTGFGHNVIIASPASLMALLKAAAYGWRQESIEQNAREISKLGQELHGRLGTMAEHFARLGRSLGSATENYNAALASFESRVLVSARKFKELGATSQEADVIELRPVEKIVSRLQAVEKPSFEPEAEAPKSS